MNCRLRFLKSLLCLVKVVSLVMNHYNDKSGLFVLKKTPKELPMKKTLNDEVVGILDTLLISSFIHQ